jgi:hypothetical protein
VDDDKYDGVLKALSELHATWQEFKAESLALIVEHRKTVNSAISSLAQESLESQADTKQRLAADSAMREKRQTRTDRKDFAVLSGVGCLLIANGMALLALAVLVIWLLSR